MTLPEFRYDRFGRSSYVKVELNIDEDRLRLLQQALNFYSQFIGSLNGFSTDVSNAIELVIIIDNKYAEAKVEQFRS